MPDCVFCRIIAGEVPAHVVHEDDQVTVFLDNGPLFPGHCLVCPKQHVDTFLDLPPELVSPLFETAKLVARALEACLNAQGSFIAINNKISQSVPHLHVHVIPRRRGDGMKGFFWPRRPYRDEAHQRAVQEKISAAIRSLRNGGSV